MISIFILWVIWSFFSRLTRLIPFSFNILILISPLVVLNKLVGSSQTEFQFISFKFYRQALNHSYSISNIKFKIHIAFSSRFYTNYVEIFIRFFKFINLSIKKVAMKKNIFLFKTFTASISSFFDNCFFLS